jgi:hypothetical protein
MLIGCKLTDVPSLQEIHIRQDTTDIAHASGSFDFGAVTVGGSSTVIVFTVENRGEVDLHLTGTPLVDLGGPDASLFVVDTQPASMIAAGGTTVFSIIFSPNSTGLKTATVTIENNDSDEGNYNFALMGIGTASNITISKGSATIPSGETANFGAVGVNTQNDVTFLISNLGNVDLHLVGTPDMVVKSGPDSSFFSIIAPPTSPVSPSGNTSFTVRFETGNSGSRTALLTIPNDDPSTSDYSITITASGIVPPAELHQTGMTAIKGPNDDGTLKKGLSWPDPRFTDNGDETITDHLTGLMWDKNADRFGVQTWASALNEIAAMTVGSHADWRLPNAVELRSLVNAGQSDSSVWLNSKGFSNVNAAYYHSSTKSSSNNVKMVNMATGRIENYDDMTVRRCWAVRDGTSGVVSLPKTGQSVSYSAGDDGDLQKGESWPSPRFVDNGFGALTDTLTGLMWEQSPSGTIRNNWIEALQYASSLSLGGYTDWRIPNINELMSITCYAEADYASWISSQGFIGGSGGSRWSSTSYLFIPDRAWAAVAGSGYMWDFGKSVYNYIWRVRGGR